LLNISGVVSSSPVILSISSTSFLNSDMLGISMGLSRMFVPSSRIDLLLRFPKQVMDELLMPYPKYG